MSMKIIILKSVMVWRLVTMVIGFVLMLSAGVAVAADDFDLPVCEAMTPGGSSNVALGIVDPAASPEIAGYAVRLARLSDHVSVCSESWSAVLPHWLPWSGAVERGYGFGFFALGFLLAALVAWRFTPRTWWNKPTLAGLLLLVSVTWGGGVALMAIFHLAGGQRLVYATLVSVRASGESTPQWLNLHSARELELALDPYKLLESLPPAQQAALNGNAALPQVQPLPEGSYRVHQRLNLREKSGVDAPRQTVLAAGESVVFDGARENDWWRVKTASGQTGWVNSIWLRRMDEGVGKNPVAGGKS